MKFVPDGVTRAASKAMLKTQKNSPTILFVVGIGGVVTSTVMACRSTLKLEEVMEEYEEKRETIMNFAHGEYSEKDRQQDRVTLALQTTGKLCKLYGPALIVGAASVFCLTKSHNILVKRNAALTAAYTTVAAAFEEYRQRVRDEYGDEVDRKMRFGTEQLTVVEDTDKGPKKKNIDVFGPGTPSGYARFFQEGNKNWSPVPEYNIMFLRGMQNSLNDQLRSRGHVFLNEVYDELGLERSTAGQIVGWVWDSEDGDNYIDFGIFTDKSRTRVHDFVMGREQVILLDFNVDGPIHEKI